MTSDLQAAKDAAYYFQDYIRANRPERAEQAREANPSQGYGSRQDARDAYQIALHVLVHRCDEFVNCSIPENFASPEYFRSELQALDAVLKHEEGVLSKHAAADDPTITVWPILKDVRSCRAAVAETLRQLGAQSAVGEGDAFDVLDAIAERFHRIVHRLAKTRKGQDPYVMANEYDVQRLFEALLEVHFDDIRPEENGPSVAGSSPRADTLLKAERIIVEYKMTREGKKASDYRKELADDFIIYEAHPDCDRLFIFIYDPHKAIANPVGFERDMSKPRTPYESVRTRVQQG